MAKDAIESEENFTVAIIALSKVENKDQRIKSIGTVKTRYFARKIIVFLKFLLKIFVKINEVNDIIIKY